MNTIFEYKMNSKDKWMLIISFGFLVYVLLLFVRDISMDEPSPNHEKASEKHVSRQSITFIMGEDHEDRNPFYQNAEIYFRNNPKGMTDHVVTHCRSLAEVLSVLDRYYELIQQPFSLINIVAHSNPWTGISMSLLEGGDRITTERLELAIKEDLIKISSGGVDQETEIVFHACGLGNNKNLVLALQNSFSSKKGQTPKVVVDDHYINFERKGDQIFRTEMKVFYAYYPTAFKPADLHLVRQLKLRYPKENIDWLNALNQEIITSHSEIFSYRYNVPVEWEVLYPEYDAPLLPTREDEMEWLWNQDKLIEIVENTEIPFDDFRWILKKGDKEYEEGYSVPFIKVYGKATVVCILRPVINNAGLKV